MFKIKDKICKPPKIRLVEKLYSLLQNENNNIAAWSNGEHNIIYRNIFMLISFFSFDQTGETAIADDNKFLSNLGMKLEGFRSQMPIHSFKRVINDIGVAICKSSLPFDDVSSILKLN